MTTVRGRERHPVYIWAAVVGLVFILCVGVYAVSGGAGFKAESHVLVSLEPLQPDETIEQFDALDQAHAMGTIVDYFASSDLFELALEDAGVPEADIDLYQREVENPEDSLIVAVSVTGPNGRVTPIANSLATLGATGLQSTFSEVSIISVESLPADALTTGAVVVIALLAMAAFVATALLLVGEVVDVESGTDLRELRRVIANWVRERGPGESETSEWPRPRLALLIGLLGLGAGAFAVSPVYGAGVLGGALLALATMFAIKYPRWLLVGLVLLVLFRLSDIGTDFFGAPEISIPYAAFVLAVIGARKVLFAETRDGWLGLGIAVFALIAIMSLSSLQAADQVIAFDRTFDVAKNGLVALIMVALVREIADLRAVVWTLIGGTAFLSALGIASQVFGEVPGLLEGFAQTVDEIVDEVVVAVRIAGPIGDANFFGQLLVTVFPFALERSWRERSISLRLTAGAAAVLIVIAVVLTNSRGAMLGLAVCVLLFLVWLRPPAPAMVLAAIVVAGALIFVPSGYLQRLGSIGDVISVLGGTTTVDPSIQGRTSEVVVGLQMFHDYPLIGVGPGNYPGRYIEYSPEVGLDYRSELRQPHSLPVEAAAELGLLGLTWWFLVIVFFGRSMLGSIRASRQVGDREITNYLEAIVIALCGFLTTALFLHLDFARFFWMIVGVAVATERIARARRFESTTTQEPVLT